LDPALEFDRDDDSVTVCESERLIVGLDVRVALGVTVGSGERDKSVSVTTPVMEVVRLRVPEAEITTLAVVVLESVGETVSENEMESEDGGLVTVSETDRDEVYVLVCDLLKVKLCSSLLDTVSEGVLVTEFVKNVVAETVAVDAKVRVGLLCVSVTEKVLDGVGETVALSVPEMFAVCVAVPGVPENDELGMKVGERVIEKVEDPEIDRVSETVPVLAAAVTESDSVTDELTEVV
jgi:hypothetical protein